MRLFVCLFSFKDVLPKIFCRLQGFFKRNPVFQRFCSVTPVDARVKEFERTVKGRNGNGNGHGTKTYRHCIETKKIRIHENVFTKSHYSWDLSTNKISRRSSREFFLIYFLSIIFKSFLWRTLEIWDLTKIFTRDLHKIFILSKIFKRKIPTLSLISSFIFLEDFTPG